MTMPQVGICKNSTSLYNVSMYNVIDISQWQGRIDWETVKGHIDGAIIRCGWGSDYASQDDTYYEYNCAECERLGIPYGVYLYSYATSEYGARSEAAHALRLIEGKRLSLPVYFDSEESGTESAAKICAETFCDILRERGYTPGVYASLSWWNSNLRGIDNVSKWCACWGSGSPGMECDIWQYTSNGSVPGINGRVDMNECYRELDEMISKNDANEIWAFDNYGDQVGAEAGTAWRNLTDTNIRVQKLQDDITEIKTKIDKMQTPETVDITKMIAQMFIEIGKAFSQDTQIKTEEQNEA